MSERTFNSGFPQKLYATTGDFAIYELQIENGIKLLAWLETSYKYRDEGLFWRDVSTSREVSGIVLGWRAITPPEIIEGRFFRAEKADGQWIIKAIDLQKDARTHYPKDYNFALKRVRTLDLHRQHEIERDVEFSLGRRLTLEELISDHGFNPKYDPSNRYYHLVES